jgi:hypothetical protein
MEGNRGTSIPGRRRGTGHISTENFHLVISGNCENCKTLTLRGAERAASAALVFEYQH